MSKRIFIQILLVNCLILMSLNMLFAIPVFKSLVLENGLAISIGIALAVYLIQLAVTSYMLRDKASWFKEPFKLLIILRGIFAFMMVIALSTALAKFSDANEGVVAKRGIPGGYMMIFLLNSIPGAMMEEWLFRYLPLKFTSFNLSKLTLILLVATIFPFIHLPAYLFQYGNNLTDLFGVFFWGIVFLIVYLMTRNLFFVVLFHAFGNNPLFYYESINNFSYYYACAAIVAITWYFIIYAKQRRDASPLSREK